MNLYYMPPERCHTYQRYNLNFFLPYWNRVIFVGLKVCKQTGCSIFWHFFAYILCKYILVKKNLNALLFLPLKLALQKYDLVFCIFVSNFTFLSFYFFSYSKCIFRTNPLNRLKQTFKIDFQIVFKQYSAVNYFCEIIHLRCSSRLWVNL